jgi:hypothetical protein
MHALVVFAITLWRADGMEWPVLISIKLCPNTPHIELATRAKLVEGKQLTYFVRGVCNLILTGSPCYGLRRTTAGGVAAPRNCWVGLGWKATGRQSRRPLGKQR